METNTCPFSQILLSDNWSLQCSHNDTKLLITVFKLESKIKFTKCFQSVPQKFEILAESLTELAALFMESKGLQFQQNCLNIKCQIGNKTKNVGIILDTQEIPAEIYSKNLQKLLENHKNNQIKSDQQYNKKIKQLEQENFVQKKQIVKLNQMLQKQKKQLSELTQSIEQGYYQCSKWGCQVLIAKKNIKYHKTGRSGFICGDECSY